MGGRGGQGGYKLGKTVIYEDDDEVEEVDEHSMSVLSSSIPTKLPPASAFSEKKTQIRLDGLEPYVLVSAITATASFDVVTGGKTVQFFMVVMFGTKPFDKAALAREDEAHQVYQQFFDFTASYRYKGYQAFLWSLILFVMDLFLFAIAYLPESIRPFAALGAAPIIYTCWNDWQAVIKAASIIYAPATPIQVDNDDTNDVDFNGDNIGSGTNAEQH
ncbi:unnamed protein product [Cylindrotheca closterium]|uniref:Uncharacterized protein n=1 Tax=Cylindrotheca closterium TaxID=2856 RepID=A0AAD2PUN6_9STRA|nr:unnamed protein product [Cylindrotheca closterium]